MVAVGLLHGELTADHYEDAAAADPRIDALRARMTVTEDPRYTAEYLDPAKRSIANAVQVHFSDGSATERVEVEYPLGHRRRRAEGVPLLERKLAANLATRFPAGQAARIMAACLDQDRFESTPVDEFLDLLVI
jgi:2-methylcitrate dehydratase PrpD